MTFKVGDYVGFSFQQHTCDSGAFLIFDNDWIFKGKVEKVKKYDFFIFKREYPKYKVCGIWVNEKTLKPIKTCYAILGEKK